MDYRLIVRGLFVGLMYFVFGKLGLLLALPPGFATVVFPSSGIALVAIALWGLPAAFGVWFGSFILNLSLVESFLDLSSFSLPALIATGALLQSGIGAFLVKHFHRKDFDFSSLAYIIKYVLIGGFISSLVNASWSVTLLYDMGKISAEQFFSNWVSWYLGDVVGIISIGPMFWIFASGFYGDSFFKKIKSSLPVLLSFITFIIIFVLASDKEEKSAEELFQTRVSGVLEGIQRDIDEIDNSMINLRGLYYASQEVSREEFESFSKLLKTKNDFIVSIQWIPRIGWSEKKQIESKLKERNPYFHGILVMKKGEFKEYRRNNYFPVAYVYPVEINSGTVGFDLFSVVETMDAIVNSYETNKNTVTGFLRYDFLPESKALSSSFLPVYKKKYRENKIHQSFESLDGMLSVSFSWEKVIEKHLEKNKLSMVSVSFQEESYRDDIERLTFEKGKWSDMDAVYESVSSFNKLNRKWTLRVKSPKFFYYASVHKTSWYILFYGMLFSSVLGIFGLYVTGQRKKMNNLNVVIRKKIETEKIIQLKSARHIAAGELASGIAHEINNPLAIIHSLAERSIRRIEEGSVEEVDLKKDLEKVYESVIRVSKIISSLRKLAKENNSIEKKEAKLKDSFEEVLILVEQKFTNHRVELNYSEAPELLVKMGPSLLNQTLLGMLNASYKFVKDKNGSWIDLKWSMDESNIKLRVVNSDLALDQQSSENIFYNQNSLEANYDEAALGIYISREVALEAGGDLRYENYRGKSSFVLILPCLEEEEDKAA